MLLAIGNVFVGLHIGKPTGTHKFVAGYIAFLAAILTLAVLGSAYDVYRSHKAVSHSDQLQPQPISNPLQQQQQAKV